MRKFFFIVCCQIEDRFSPSGVLPKKMEGGNYFETPKLMRSIHDKRMSVGYMFFKVEISLLSFNQDKVQGVFLHFCYHIIAIISIFYPDFCYLQNGVGTFQLRDNCPSFSDSF